MFPADDPNHQPPLETGFEDTVEDEGSSKPLFTDKEGDGEWLRYARDSYTSSDLWFGSSMRTTLERAFANFRGVHPPGSKYHTEQYLKKSRIFRPKTRSAIRRGEAATAVAFFSTNDVVHCSALNESDQRHRLAADVHNALINTRLTDPQQFWFKTLIGGVQDAMTTGTVISKQEWEYEEAEIEVDVTYESDGIDGRPIQEIRRESETRVLRDRPCCRLVPIENLRIDAACDWIDPINSSPYVIELIPTYIHDIQKKVRSGKYRPVAMEVMHAAIKQDWDSIRKAREGGTRLDKYDADNYINEFHTVWVHHNIVHIDGQDWVYDTLGTEVLLSDPVPIEERYLHCQTYQRPYRLGNAILEAHKNYPGGIPQLIEDLQEEANDLANLRIDNIRHALNPRWLVRRGSGVDVRGLIRNIASGVTYAQNVTNDVRELRAQDVTGSSFAEQDRINLDMDEVIGTFSAQSVQANRKLNETVGGMNIMSSDASRLEDYLIRTMAETWVEGVMTDFVRMEAAYESDERILSIVAASLKSDIDEIMDVIDEPVLVKCNVGFGATNPERKIQRFSLGMATVNAYNPRAIMELDQKEVVDEVFGILGYKDGSRFFPNLYSDEVDPMVQQLQQQVAELQAQLQPKLLESQTKLQTTQLQEQTKLRVAEMKQQVDLLKIQAEGVHMALQKQIDRINQQLDIEDSARKREELFLQREALSHSILESDREFALKIKALEDAKTKAESGGKAGGDPTPGAMNLAGNDKAGVISRDDYGMIPQEGG